MKSQLTILFIEDNASHRADLKAMLQAELPKLPVSVLPLFAENLRDAQALVAQADAVLTDVFFPDTPGGNPDVPNGQLILDLCLFTNKPVVWCTSTYHHGSKSQSSCELGRYRGIEMFDCDGYNNPEIDAAHKPWKEAFYGLLYSIVALELGERQILDGKFVNAEGLTQGSAIFPFLIRHWFEGTVREEEQSIVSRLTELGFRP